MWLRQNSGMDQPARSKRMDRSGSPAFWYGSGVARPVGSGYGSRAAHFDSQDWKLARMHFDAFGRYIGRKSLHSKQ